MLKRLAIHDGRLTATEDPGAPLRIYIAPTESERRHLVDDLHLDEHTLASSLDPDELCRLEFEPDHFAIICKRARSYTAQDNMLFRVLSAGMFLFKDFLVIVLAEDVPLLEGRQFLRVTSLQDIILKVIHRAILHFEEHLKVINIISGQLEQEISTAMENRHLLNLFTLEKSLVYYVNAINSNGVLIGKLRNNAVKLGLTPDNLELLDDVSIENDQCRQQAQIYSDILASMMDARVSIVSNNLNLLMKTLNIITIGIMMPTLVVSIFSMNVLLPLPQGEDAWWPFWVVMAIAAACGIGIWHLWRRKWR